MDSLDRECRSRTVARFDDDWWDKFLNATDRLQKANVFEGAISKPDTAQMRRCVLDIIHDVAVDHRDKYGIRLWLDGELQNSKFLFDNPPASGDTVETWVDRVFGDRKFGIILNRGEKFSEGLSSSIAQKFAPLIAANGMPTEGLLFTLFIGNYDNTPLGIHKDLPGKCVVHFHLGPGSKEMYTWPDGVLEAKLGPVRNNIYDVDAHLHCGIRHEFGEGDLYFMPSNTYHVGRQSGLSIAVGAWYNNRSKHDFAQRLLSLVRERYLRPSSEMLFADREPPEQTDVIDPTIDLFDFPPELHELTFRDLLKAVYRDFRFALASNAGLRNPPIPRSDDVDLRKIKSVRMAKPYVIKHLTCPDLRRMKLFVRGTILEINIHPLVIKLIDLLGSGESVDYSSLRAMCFSDMDAAVLDYCIQQFVKYRGAEVF